MRRLAVAGVALLVFVIALAAWMPAALVLPLLWPGGSPLALDDVRGSLWRGHAGVVRWRGEPLGSLDWRASPAALLEGEYVAQLHLGGALNASARLHAARAGGRLEQVALVFPGEWLAGALATPALQPRGTVEVRIESLELAQGELVALVGNATWREAAVSGAASAPLGELGADFSLAPTGTVHGQLRDSGGPLALSGSFEVSASGYRADLRLAARDPALHPALAWIGQAQGDARHLLLQGPLEPAVAGAGW